MPHDPTTPRPSNKDDTLVIKLPHGPQILEVLGLPSDTTLRDLISFLEAVVNSSKPVPISTPKTRFIRVLMPWEELILGPSALLADMRTTIAEHAFPIRVCSLAYLIVDKHNRMVQGPHGSKRLGTWRDDDWRK
jgi:hypothetical protein